MKIYGQSLGDIFKKLPWQYKIVVVLGSAFILFVMVYAPPRLMNLGLGKKPEAGPLKILRSEQKSPNVFDPAIAYDPKSEQVWMAYTSTSAPQESGVPLQIRIASARAGACDNWSQTNGGFDAKTDDLIAPDGQTVFRSGIWRVETPALVHDPDDLGKEWKLYAYKYFWSMDPRSPLQVAQHYGMIVYKYSPDPAKGWSTEEWLFSPAPDYPPPPYEQMIPLHLNTLDPGLRDISTYARPSVIYKDGTLVMTLSAFTADSAAPDRIIMIVSQDHGKTWKYAGTVLQGSDPAKIGPYTHLMGATLIERNGKAYLAAVLSDETQRGKGTFIFGFDDLMRGLLQREPETGTPILLNHVPLLNAGDGAMGGGFAAYTDACTLGLVTAEQSPGALNFRILKTYKDPLKK